MPDGLNHMGQPSRGPWWVFYLAATVMGVMYLTGFTNTLSLAGATDSFAAHVWQWTLLMGGAVALAGNLAPRRHWRWASTAEAAGGASTALMVAVYVSSIAGAPVTTNPPWATIVWMSAVAGILALRAIGVMHQRRRAVALDSIRREMVGGGDA